MSKVEALRRAVMELGDVSAEALAAHAATAFGVKIDPRIVPVLKATLKDKEMLASWKRTPAPAPAPAASSLSLLGETPLTGR